MGHDEVRATRTRHGRRYVLRPIPRVGDDITLAKDSGGYALRVTSVEHTCDLETRESVARGLSRADATLPTRQLVG
jgi:hypothetical protein